jgi:CheY-like chemotaxis protein
VDFFILERPREILVVEDSKQDQQMVLWALDKNQRGKSVVTLMDGEQAMTYLHTRQDGLMPDLILLDLNMPRMDGWQVLALCKGNEALKAVPIVVFSTSKRDEDVKRCYALGANSFVPKPFELEGFKKAIAMIEDYWLGLSLA